MIQNERKDAIINTNASSCYYTLFSKLYFFDWMKTTKSYAEWKRAVWQFLEYTVFPLLSAPGAN